MEKFDLSRLSATAFERMVRALCFELMGPGGVVYSSGPDGARDYTFQGKIPGYGAKGWNGYLVVQAKYREERKGGEKDISWLKSQLSNEYEKFTDEDIGLRKPDYYIVVTNISLSGADGKASNGKEKTGGYTKISRHLDDWKKSLGLLDYDIWANDKIIDLLTGSEAVRTTYAAWITPGDVLTAVLNALSSKNTVLKRAINRGLRESLKKDQYARLRDAGGVEEPIRVAQVFVDLPIRKVQKYDDDAKDIFPNRQVRQNRNLVATVLSRAREKFDPVTLCSYPEDAEKKGGPNPNQIVILGGPGQGKSTAGIFIAQLFRALLLENLPKNTQDEKSRPLIPEIIQRARSEGITNHSARRYPAFVSLPRLADAITKARAEQRTHPSVLAQIALELSISCDTEVSRDDVREWLAVYPWIIIFDGLDEVPSSGERNAILEAINAFQEEIIDLNADALLIVTTRPQGFNGDLSKEYWEHWYLEDLSKTKAISYAQSLGQVRYPSDNFRQNEILASLEAAMNQAATARLMTSPLQVTIMYLIADTGGNIPASRWTLFNEYFEILKKREKAKGSHNQNILESNWPHISPLHQRAGLVLQTDSEHTGNARSYLNKHRFSKMVEDYLLSEGFSEIEAGHRTNELITVALDRLVLLSAREEGKITFDVRSLQEFMAAYAITDGSDSDVEERLIHIVSLSHWRNVFFIAASRCFSDNSKHHFRPLICNIVRSLDFSESGRQVRAGAQVAMNLYAEGIGLEHPMSRKLLARHAIELLQNGPLEYDERLEILYDNYTKEVVVQSLNESLSKTGSAEYHAAWRLLSILTETDHANFFPVFQANWPSSSESVASVLRNLRALLPSERIIGEARRAILSRPPSCAIEDCGSLFNAIKKNYNNPNFSTGHRSLMKLDFFSDMERFGQNYSFNSNEKIAALRMTLIPYDDKERFKNFLELEDHHPYWNILICAAVFAESPTKHTLAAAIQKIVDYGALDEAKALRGYMPWPLEASITLAFDSDDTTELIRKIENGEYGDSQTWAEAQTRWKEFGITERDFQAAKYTVEGERRMCELPPYFTRYSISHQNPTALKTVACLKNLSNTIELRSYRDLILRLIQFSTLGLNEGELAFSNRELVKYIKILAQNGIPIQIEMFAHCNDSIWNDIEFLEEISRANSLYKWFRPQSIERLAPLMIAAYCLRPDLRGLIILIAASLCAGKKSKYDTLLLLPAEAMTVKIDDSLEIAFCLCIITLAAKAENARQQFSRLVATRASSKFSDTELDLLCDYLDDEDFIPNDRIEVITKILGIEKDLTNPYVRRLRDHLRKLFDVTRSSFTETSMWKKCGLPADAFSILQSSNPVE